MAEKQLKDEIAYLKEKLSLQAEELEQKNREIKIERALDSVRLRATAMRTSAELAETSAGLFQQLHELGITAVRTAVGIFDDANDAMELWLTGYSKEKKMIGTLDYVNLHMHPVFENILASRKEQKPFALTILRGEEVKNFYHELSIYISEPEPQEYNPEEFFYSFYFPEGTINITANHSLTENECDMMSRFTQVFGLIYRRFLDLQKAEKQTRDTEQALAELRSAQSQLIEAEKMASLGELTAGIAHEIQNPLNFVNNFADVNKELIEELKTELKNGRVEEAVAIAKDIQENEDRILHHGKRADAIVKSMLQHSRAGTGVKELTDINMLCDEYIRLSYHGLRAKDKSFNAKYEIDLDPAVQPVEVVPQDIGRVLLNLINNAFYAASKKAASMISQFTPTVSLTTKKEPGKLVITVKDNGNGIPEKDFYKIFHPFFTTKPSGEGTGLGLSISYDIVKAHGGDIQVESSPGKWCRFIVSLPA